MYNLKLHKHVDDNEKHYECKLCNTQLSNHDDFGGINTQWSHEKLTCIDAVYYFKTLAMYVYCEETKEAFRTVCNNVK